MAGSQGRNGWLSSLQAHEDDLSFVKRVLDELTQHTIVCCIATEPHLYTYPDALSSPADISYLLFYSEYLDDTP